MKENNENEKTNLLEKNNVEKELNYSDKKNKDSLLKILLNLENDLKNNCEKEFDLKNPDYYKDYPSTEIFGTPTCYNIHCPLNNSSSVKLFHCSHCKRIFCQECFPNHNETKNKSIYDSLSKYIPENNKNYEIKEIENKKIPEKFNRCKRFVFVGFLATINFLYLMPIFTLKTIKKSLEIIIVNCIKEISSEKIEEPNSLFNFYEIFFEQVNTLSFNFDLFMTMSWFGDRLLQSCGFIMSCIFFIIINCSHFILLFNFDFLEFTENNKYTIWKFLHLISIYVLLFIGIGGSSLLSQKIFHEFFKKIEETIKNEDDDEENYDVYNKDRKDKNNNEINTEIKEEEKLIRKKTKISENLKNNKTFITFSYITLTTVGSFFADYFFNIYVIIKNKIEIDEKIKNETYSKYNSNFIEESYNNNNITYITYKKIFENDKNIFFYTYSLYYIILIVTSIFCYLIVISCCLIKATKKKGKQKIFENIIENNNNDGLIKKAENNLIINEINENKDSYSLYKICGFIFYRETTDLRGDISNSKKFLYCISDFCVLNCRTLIDFCNITFCSILNIIFWCGNNKYKCCCYFDDIQYNKVSENFCFCYKEKRKYKWLHDYIINDIQKDLFPYLLEFFVLGLIVINMEKKLVNFKYDSTKDIKYIWDEGFSSNNLYNIKIILIILITLILFFMLSIKIGKKKLKKSEITTENKSYLMSYFILNGIHIILLINSIISLTFSILYFSGINDFDAYILIPILMYKSFYLILNYYCILVSEKQKGNELILSGAMLVSIYIIVWNAIYTFIQNNIENDKILFIFQMVISLIIIFVFIYYLIFSNSNFKHHICNNFNLCGLCQICFSYDIFCDEGSLISNCCCCDENCHCCYSEKCDINCFICHCCNCSNENNTNNDTN